MKIHIEIDTVADDTSDIHNLFSGLTNAFAVRSPFIGNANGDSTSSFSSAEDYIEKNPLPSRAPSCPFEPHDRVVVISTGDIGTVEVVYSGFSDVKLDGSERLTQFRNRSLQHLKPLADRVAAVPDQKKDPR